MQGQGLGTSIKELRLYKVMRQRLMMTRNLPGVFWYFDLNAGCGWNNKVMCEGSPLVFLAASRSVGRPFRAVFVEKDPRLCEQLGARIPEHFRDSVEIWQECNRLALPRLARLAGNSLGLLLSDPNGPGPRTGYHHGELLSFARATCRVDLLLNLNATALNKIEGAARLPSLAAVMPDIPRMIEDLRSTRKHYMVAPPPKLPTGHTFFQWLLTNHPGGLHGWKDFVPRDDPRSDRIIRTRSREIIQQRELFS